MKRFLLCLIVFSAVFNAKAQTVIFQNFDNMLVPGGWSVNSNVDPNPWAIVADYTGLDLDGTPFFFVDSDGAAQTDHLREDLATNIFNGLLYSNLSLSFDHFYKHLTSNAYVDVWDGSSWQNLETFTADAGAFGAPAQATYDLTPYRNPLMQVRFRYDDNDTWSWYWALDNVHIYVPAQNDLGVDSIVSPRYVKCSLAPKAVTVHLTNYTGLDQSNFPISYSVNGGAAITETFTTTLPAFTSANYTFASLYDFTNEGTFELASWTSLAGDTNFSNDTTSFAMDYAIVNTYPYIQNFDNFDKCYTFSCFSECEFQDGWEPDRFNTANSNMFVDTFTYSVNSGPGGDHTTGTSNFVFTGNCNFGHVQITQSPCFDLSSLLFPTLEFYSFMYGANMGSMNVDVSDDAGQSWQTIWTQAGEVQTSRSDPWTRVELDLSAYKSTNMMFRFRSVMGINSSNKDAAIDDVRIYDLVYDDLKMNTYIEPNSGCGLDANQLVTVVVENIGTTTPTSYDISYQVNGGPINTQTMGSTAPFQIDTITFAATTDMSTIGSYNLKAWTDLAGDLDHTSDTIYWSVASESTINFFPYIETFEGGNGGWVSDASNVWEVGVPSNTIINSAPQGNNAYVTNLTGDFTGANLSSITSPCFDFSSLSQDPEITFELFMQTEYFNDPAWLDYSLDGGYTWNKLGSLNSGINWYATPISEEWSGSTGRWVTASHIVTGSAGQNGVKFRFNHNASISGNDEGVGIDYIRIMEPYSQDIAVDMIYEPQSGCGLSNDEKIAVVVTNEGYRDATNFDMSYSVNGGAVNTEVYSGTLQVGATDTFYFSNGADLSAPIVYDIVSWMNLPFAINDLNDTASVSIQGLTKTTSFPYREGFESGDGGWFTNAGWERGLPANTFINAAAEGGSAWVSNLDGDYTNGAEDYLYSPCFDFSSFYIDPEISFDIIYELENNYDDCWLEYSLDGVNWIKLGSIGSGTNWYNVSDNWTGISSGWNTARHALPGLAGESSVQFRFVLDTDGSVSNEGVGIDAISIALPCSDPYEPNNSRPAALVLPTAGVNTEAALCAAGDEDWYFISTGVYENVKVALRCLADDYDLELYDLAGTLLASSRESGLENEIILYNGAGSGTSYYIRVFGASGSEYSSIGYCLKTTYSNAPIWSEAEALISDLSSISEVQLIPNPVGENQHPRLNFSSPSEEPVHIEIVDLLGRLLTTQSTVANKGPNSIELAVAELPAGLYFVKIKCGGEQKVVRMEVLRF